MELIVPYKDFSKFIIRHRHGWEDCLFVCMIDWLLYCMLVLHRLEIMRKDEECFVPCSIAGWLFPLTSLCAKANIAEKTGFFRFSETPKTVNGQSANAEAAIDLPFQQHNKTEAIKVVKII